MSSFTVLTLLICSCVVLSGVDAGRSLYASTMSTSASGSNSQLVSSTKVGSKTVYNVTWTQVSPNSYEDILAQCGDEVIFNWGGNTHDVGIAKEGNCDKIDDLLAQPANRCDLYCQSQVCMHILQVMVAHSGSFRVILDNKIKSIKEDGEVYFACSIGRHCASGKQIIEFYVVCHASVRFHTAVHCYTENAFSRIARPTALWGL